VTYGVVNVNNLDIQLGDALHRTQRTSVNLMWNPVSFVDIVVEFLAGETDTGSRADEARNDPGTTYANSLIRTGMRGMKRCSGSIGDVGVTRATRRMCRQSNQDSCEGDQPVFDEPKGGGDHPWSPRAPLLPHDIGGNDRKAPHDQRERRACNKKRH
jgi:hypothetical protein